MKVLIAEDDSTSAIVLRKALEKLGHEAVVATDGEQAYTLLSQDTKFEYRIVISDWMMPGMDGLELTRKLRSEREVGDPLRFVILLTARGRPEDRRMGLEAGADDFMVKPMDMGDLIPRLSIAERMLRLEDALNNTATAPFYGGVTTTAPPTDVSALETAAEEALGEEAAKQILFAAVREFNASEIHFEPQSSGEYRARARTLAGVFRSITGDVKAAAQFFVLHRKQAGKAIWTGREGNHSITVATEILPIRSGGNRVFLRVLHDSRKHDETVRLADLPMTDSVRDELRIALSSGRQDGGLLVVCGSRSDQDLVGRAVNAIKEELTNDETLVLDIADIAYEEAFGGIGGEDHSDTPLIADPMTGLREIMAHRPDVVIARELSPYQHYHHPSLPPIPYFICSEIGSSSGQNIAYTFRSTLQVIPILPDGGNVQDRFRFNKEYQDGDEYDVEEPFDA